jgi:hypothetical protein
MKRIPACMVSWNRTVLRVCSLALPYPSFARARGHKTTFGHGMEEDTGGVSLVVLVPFLRIRAQSFLTTGNLNPREGGRVSLNDWPKLRVRTGTDGPSPHRPHHWHKPFFFF